MQVCLMFGLSRRDLKNLRICFHLKDFSSFFLHPHGGFPQESHGKQNGSPSLLLCYLSYNCLFLFWGVFIDALLP